MNTYITLSCLLAVACLAHGSAIGLGGWGGHGLGGLGLSGLGLGSASIISTPILAPAAISSQNIVRAAPIPVVRTISAPIVSVPIIKSVPVVSSVISPVGLGLGGIGHGVGLGGLSGLGGLGGHGLHG